MIFQLKHKTTKAAKAFQTKKTDVKHLLVKKSAIAVKDAITVSKGEKLVPAVQ